LPSNLTGVRADTGYSLLDEPIRRYFEHAIGHEAQPGRSVGLRLRGRIKVGMWLRFDSMWEGDARSFSWRARAGPGPIRVLDVHDQFADGRGSMRVALRRLNLVDAHDEDTARSGAGRAALEAVWTPGALLPERGVQWRAESESEIVAAWDVPRERPEVHLGIEQSAAAVSRPTVRPVAPQRHHRVLVRPRRTSRPASHRVAASARRAMRAYEGKEAVSALEPSRVPRAPHRKP
jgi:hypothetical protein